MQQAHRLRYAPMRWGRRCVRFWRSHWRTLTATGLPALVVAACAVPLVLTATAARTVLSADFYAQGLDRADAYNRVYTEVLPDPAVDDLLAGLPVDDSLVTANLRTVLPPSTLRGVAEAQIDDVVGYLRADTDDIAFTVDLRAVLEGVSGLANRYVADELGENEIYQVDDIQQFTAGVVAAMDAIANGRPPESLPRLDLSQPEVDLVLPVVLGRVPQGERDDVAAPLEAALLAGDLPGAIAMIGDDLFAGDEQAVADLAAKLDGGTVLDVGVSLSDLRGDPAVDAVDRVHDVAAVLPWTTAALGLLAAGGLAVTGWNARRRGGSAVRAVGWSVLAAGAACLVAGVALRAALPNPFDQLEGPQSPLPPGASQVLADVGEHLYGGVTSSYLRLSLWLVVVGGAAVAVSLVRTVTAKLSAPGRARTGAAYAAVAASAVGAMTWLAFPGAAADSPSVCNGAAHLCDRRYDEVVYAATHNAMANSEDRFLGPSQDLTIVHQLDLGVRALLVDLHHWTAPSDVEDFLSTLTPRTRAAVEPLARGAVSTRPGVWLCHNLCQLGASNARTEFTQLRAWMERNPTEVVTVVVQDEVDASEILEVVAAAGLSELVATPPDDVDGQWPTLGEMVGTGHRLFVFTERQDLPGSYLRNFFRYATDTPFDNRLAGDLDGCTVGRGRADNPLLLVNHWITDVAPNRAAALAVNSFDVVVDRARRCADSGRTPTFVAVDFVSTGELVAAVGALNSH